EAGLGAFGHRAARRMLARVLDRRFQVLEFAARHPEALAPEIEDPVFVAGLPRTGTTLLFNLLAQDARMRPLLGWEAFFAVPPRPGHKDRRRARHRRQVRAIDWILPDLKRVHPLDADGPEECIPLLLRTFVTSAWTLYAHVPSYRAWLAAQPPEVLDETYRLHPLQLRTHQGPGPDGRRWLLKSPAHLKGLAALLRIYPDARVVRTHRDLAHVVPSACSLLAVFRALLVGRVDPFRLGREALALGRDTLEHLTAVGEGEAAGRIVDVEYDDLVSDPFGAVVSIQGRLGRRVSPAMEAAMRRWLADHPRHRHGVHRYSLEAFGITPEEIAALEAEAKRVERA
ncbi:MAG: sulfotransferase, partial [Planctomycetota bacterium]